MHAIVFDVAVVWIASLVGISILFLFRAISVVGRILILNVLSSFLVAALSLFAAGRAEGGYLDAALVLAIFSFVQILAAARYHAERKFLP